MYFPKDKMDIYRKQMSTDGNGEETENLVLVASEISCHLSINDVKSVNVNGGVVVTESNFVIFCYNNVDVKEGDLIYIDDYKFKSSTPKNFKYLKKFEIGVTEWKE